MRPLMHFMLFISLLFNPSAHNQALAASPTPVNPSTTLRQLADQKRPPFYIGTAVVNLPFDTDPIYQTTTKTQFNMLTPGNSLKWLTIHPAKDRYDFTQGDELVAFALQNKMRVRGHTLVWHQGIPAWVLKGNYNRDQLMAILKDHIQTVVSHYKGKVAEWDVVNEAIEPYGAGLRQDSFWLQGIGPDYIALAFQWAHAADPNALLFYNDYNTEDLGAKSNTQYQLMQSLVQAHVPINGVGLQMHEKTKIPILPATLSANMKRLSDLGLKIAVTEIDVSVKEPAQEDMTLKLQKQATMFGNALSSCMGNPACRSFTVWGFADAYSWQADAQPNLFSNTMQPKPSFWKLQEILYKMP